jgi:hypothetical protein
LPNLIHFGLSRRPHVRQCAVERGAKPIIKGHRAASP